MSGGRAAEEHANDLVRWKNERASERTSGEKVCVRGRANNDEEATSASVLRRTER